MRKISVHTEAVNQFLQGDPGSMAALAGGTYHQNTRVLEIPYFNMTCKVDNQGQVSLKNNPSKLSKNETTLILQYLVNTSGIQPRGQWISFLQLPDGPHHHIPFKIEAMDPLAQYFGNSLDKLVKSASTLGGEPLSIGELGFCFKVFPKLPMAVALWSGDDEFPPQSNVLFDANAPLHLTTAQLWVLGVQLVSRLTSRARLDYL